MSLTLTYDNTLSRVRATVTGLTDDVVVRVERSTNQVTWTTVRGGTALTPTGGTVTLDDYEFAADVTNYYRIRGATIFDDYARTVAAGGWGTSTSGHAYTVDGTASQYSVGSGVGSMSVNALNTSFRAHLAPSLSDVDVLVKASEPVTPTGNYIRLETVVRRVDANNYYAFRAHVQTANNIDVQLIRVLAGVESTLTSAASGVTRVPGSALWLRTEMLGTTLRARIWVDGTTEPAAWQVTTTDASHTAGTINLATLFPPGNTNTLPVVITWDDLLVAVPEVTIFSASITPTLDSAWLKNIGRPFLNRPVTVVMQPDQTVTRQPRDGVFDIVGRSFPVVVTDLRTSRSWTMQVRTDTRADADTLDLVLSTGDPMFVHLPAGCQVRGGYVRIGATSQQWHPLRPEEATFTLPLTECAAPAATVLPAVGTWATVLANYADWSAVLLAHPTWADLLELVGSPSDTIVV